MHALVHSVQSLVAALAAASYAHFGVTLKDAPCSRAAEQAVVQRVPTETIWPAVAVAPPSRDRCSLVRDARKA